METEILTQEQYNSSQELLKILDNAIIKGYLEIQKTTDLVDITVIQEWIDRLKTKRSGVYGLMELYNAKVKQKEKSIETYIVSNEDTLVDISNAFYGKPDYFQHIYDYNQLTNDHLEVGQEILIPELEQIPEIVLHQTEFLTADIYNIMLGYDG